MSKKFKKIAEIWVARDKDGDVQGYLGKPEQVNAEYDKPWTFGQNWVDPSHVWLHYVIDNALISENELTYENSPKQIRIEIEN
jgi:hypothetical protein